MQKALSLYPPPPELDATLLAGRLNPNSLVRYQAYIGQYLTFAGSIDAAIDPQTLARWRRELAETTRLSPHTINLRLSIIRSLMKAAAEQGFITWSRYEEFKHVDGVSVVALADRLKPNRRVRISSEQVRTILALVEKRRTPWRERDLAIIHTLASSGLRASTLVSLRQDQIIARDGGYTLLVTTKNHIEPIEAPLSHVAFEAIQVWLAVRTHHKESPYIFTFILEKQGRGRDHITSTRLWQLMKRYSARAGLPDIKPHDWRRFVGTKIVKEYGIYQGAKALGHASIRTTADHYVIDDLTVGMTDHLY